MPTDFEKMVERYKADLMKYHGMHQSNAPASPPAQPDPPSAQPAEPMDMPQPMPPTEQQPVAPMDIPEMPSILPGEPIDMPAPAPQPEMETPAPAPQPEMDRPSPAVMESVLESDISEAGDKDEGYLQVKVSTAQDATPIEGALVTITDRENALVATMLTDDDGATRIVGVPTMPRSESEVPGISNPYDTYNIEVRKDGYFDFRSEGVPVFGGITNIQNVSLVPLPEFSGEREMTAQNTESI